LREFASSSKTAVNKFLRELNQYFKLIEGKALFRYSRKRRKYYIGVKKPRWYWINRYKRRYRK